MTPAAALDPLAPLLEAAKGGDRDAFDALVRATYVDTYTLAFRLTGDEDDARDVAQDVYLRAFRSLRRFRGDARFSTWLYRITANCASTHLGRRRRHRHEALEDDLDLADPAPEHDPVLRAEGGAQRAELVAALASLPAKLRVVVVLRDVYDLTHEVIAAELGITETAAKVRLHRARRRLRDLLHAEAETEGEAATDGEGAEAVARVG